MTDYGQIKDINHNEDALNQFVAHITKKYGRKNEIIREIVNPYIMLIYSVNTMRNKDGFKIRLISGKLCDFVQYKNGLIHGYSYHWHENGKKNIETKYTNNAPDGYYTKWDYKGNIIEIQRYENTFITFSIELHSDSSIKDLNVTNYE